MTPGGFQQLVQHGTLSLRLRVQCLGEPLGDGADHALDRRDGRLDHRLAGLLRELMVQHGRWRRPCGRRRFHGLAEEARPMLRVLAFEPFLHLLVLQDFLDQRDVPAQKVDEYPRRFRPDFGRLLAGQQQDDLHQGIRVCHRRLALAPASERSTLASALMVSSMGRLNMQSTSCLASRTRLPFMARSLNWLLRIRPGTHWFFTRPTA